jgi:hypothetical protein
MKDEEKRLYTFPWWKTGIPVALAIACFVIAIASVAWQVKHLGYRLVKLDREASWIVTLRMRLTGDGQNVTVRAMKPVPATARQRVWDLELLGEGFATSDQGDYAVWKQDRMIGRGALAMRFRAQTHPRKYTLPVVLDWDNLESGGLAAYLQPDNLTQAMHPDIRAKAETLRGSSEDVTGFIRELFDYVQNDIVYRTVGGPTDALTAFRLGEASCNGKNRLFVALARSQGIPARLCKGLILEQGETKTESHAWSELNIGGQWIPFCPTGNHFAEIPGNYLEYPKTDDRMFSYTKNIAFVRSFRIGKSAVTAEEAYREDLDNPHHVLSAWGSLGAAEFSLSLLMVILTIPVGVTIVAFARNIVGLLPFGTFLPTLIAVSFRDTGLGWGLCMFSTTIILGVGMNEFLKLFHLLHFPRLAITLTFVVTTILGLAVFANRLGYVHAAKVGMFPLAILTLTIERFSLTVEQESFRPALARLAVSLLVASVCYLAMSNFYVRSAVLVFPQLLLVCVGLNLLVGVYTGMRVTELFRFKMLLQENRP